MSMTVKFTVLGCDTMHYSRQISEFQRHVLHASSGYKKGCCAMKIGTSVHLKCYYISA